MGSYGKKVINSLKIYSKQISAKFYCNQNRDATGNNFNGYIIHNKSILSIFCSSISKKLVMKHF